MTKGKRKDQDDRAAEDDVLAAGAQAEGKQQPAEPSPQDVATLAAERDDLLERLQRVSAEYLNYQKRIGREITEAREFANAELMKDLLAVLDDMERAMEAAKANHAPEDPLLEGMHLVYDKAMEALGRHGLKRIDAQDRPFDPTCHEAMMQQPSDEHDCPTVVEELQRGYELKGRVLRPARVIVAMPASQPAEDEQPPEETTDADESE